MKNYKLWTLVLCTTTPLLSINALAESHPYVKAGVGMGWVKDAGIGELGGFSFLGAQDETLLGCVPQRPPAGTSIVAPAPSCLGTIPSPAPQLYAIQGASDTGDISNYTKAFLNDVTVPNPNFSAIATTFTNNGNAAISNIKSGAVIPAAPVFDLKTQPVFINQTIDSWTPDEKTDHSPLLTVGGGMQFNKYFGIEANYYHLFEMNDNTSGFLAMNNAPVDFATNIVIKAPELLTGTTSQLVAANAGPLPVGGGFPTQSNLTTPVATSTLLSLQSNNLKDLASSLQLGLNTPGAIPAQFLPLANKLLAATSQTGAPGLASAAFNVDRTVQTEAASLVATARYPITKDEKLFIVGRAGGAYVHKKTVDSYNPAFSGTGFKVSETQNDFGLALGAALEYSLNANWAIQLAADSLNVTSSDNRVDVATASVVYNFK